MKSEREKRRAEETRMSALMQGAGGEVVCGADAHSGKRKRRARVECDANDNRMFLRKKSPRNASALEVRFKS